MTPEQFDIISKLYPEKVSIVTQPCGLHSITRYDFVIHFNNKVVQGGYIGYIDALEFDINNNKLVQLKNKTFYSTIKNIVDKGGKFEL